MYIERRTKNKLFDILYQWYVQFPGVMVRVSMFFNTFLLKENLRRLNSENILFVT